jgi:hypothetical protein
VTRFLLLGLLALCSCAGTATPTPLNVTAEQIGAPRFAIAKTGLPHGPVTITMPNGEVLTGLFELGPEASPFAGMHVFGIGAPEPKGGNFAISAHGPQTGMACQARIANGHGPGVCRTSSGAEYEVRFELRSG